MRHAPRWPGTPGQTFYGVCGLALFAALFLAWLALQPQAAPPPTGPVLPGFSWPGSALFFLRDTVGCSEDGCRDDSRCQPATPTRRSAAAPRICASLPISTGLTR